MHCAGCGYRLADDVDGLDLRCSECGRPFDPDDPRTWERRRHPPGILMGLGIAVGLLLVVVGWIAVAIRFDYGYDFLIAAVSFIGIGFAISASAVFAAVRNRSWVGRLPILGTAVLAGWAGIAMGVDHGFRVWQRGPNPPDEAFADGAQGMVAMFAGWIPSAVVVAIMFLILLPFASGRRRLPRPDRLPSEHPSRTAPPTEPVEP